MQFQITEVPYYGLNNRGTNFDGTYFIADIHLSEFHILVVKLCSTLAKSCSDQLVKIVDLAVNEPKLDGS